MMMWIFGVICLLSATAVLGLPYREPNKDELSIYKREAIDSPYINAPFEDDNDDDRSKEIESNEDEDNDEKEDISVENRFDEEEDDEEGQEKEGPEDENPGEAVKPPSFIEGIFTWPPSFSWPPSFTWPQNISWPNFELPTMTWPSFLGGRAQVVYPDSYYYHYANYPNYPKYRLQSWNDGVYFAL